MSEKTGRAYFRDEAQRVYGAVPKTRNCAQSVVEIAGHPEEIESMAACGGGKAPGGFCGALHAALVLSPETERDALCRDFIEACGALTCKEIKGEQKTSCMECVAVGAELAERVL